MSKKQKILIADDSEINRSILINMLEKEYELLEAETGTQATALLEQYGTDIAIVLLDIIMPEMDGFGVLKFMNRNHWIEDIPVIAISAENTAEYMDQAFELGVVDFIARPFDAFVVHRRVNNTILLYAKQKKLSDMVEQQIQEKEAQSSLMIDILSHIVEFRNGESGTHVLHIRTITKMLLEQLVKKTDQYKLTRDDINTISVASALHDIGKIAIPEEVLNKPGRLDEEEYKIMKTHASIGADMLSDIPEQDNNPLLSTAYRICRWHHERYDGRGYPDGLKGDEIPIEAQITAVADVYDALTSERVYKAAFSHETSLEMIKDGKCGVFNPLVLECLMDISDQLKAMNG